LFQQSGPSATAHLWPRNQESWRVLGQCNNPTPADICLDHDVAILWSLAEDLNASKLRTYDPNPLATLGPVYQPARLWYLWQPFALALSSFVVRRLQPQLASPIKSRWLPDKLEGSMQWLVGERTDRAWRLSLSPWPDDWGVLAVPSAPMHLPHSSAFSVTRSCFQKNKSDKRSERRP
jgi:hypothetical protein